MNQKPTSVLVLSILGIIFGSLGMLGLVGTMVTLFVPFGPPNPVTRKMNSDSIYVAYMVAATALGFVLAVVLLASSIGSLSLKPWARKGMLVYAWATLIQWLLGTIFTFAYLFPLIWPFMGSPDPVAHGGAIGGIVGGTCGVFIGPILPGFVLYFFTRPHVIDAFNGIFPAPQSNFPLT
jgi:hypothetical protein